MKVHLTFFLWRAEFRLHPSFHGGGHLLVWRARSMNVAAALASPEAHASVKASHRVVVAVPLVTTATHDPASVRKRSLAHEAQHSAIHLHLPALTCALLFCQGTSCQVVGSTVALPVATVSSVSRAASAFTARKRSMSNDHKLLYSTWQGYDSTWTWFEVCAGATACIIAN